MSLLRSGSMNQIKNQIKDSEIEYYVGGNMIIEKLVIGSAPADRDEDGTAKKGGTFSDRKQYFIDKWKADLFLHQSWDGTKLTLQQAFIFPEYEFMGQQYDDLGQRLENFWGGAEHSMLLLGTPGMGKTSIIACLAEHYKDDDDMLFLRFRDLNVDHTDGINLLESVCRATGCDNRVLSGKKLIIDGFDEWRYAGDKQRLLREYMLNIMDFDDVQVLITSRYNYIDLQDVEFEQVIGLLPFSRKKIGMFYQLLCGAELPEDTEIRNQEVLGIPVILYMALSIDADITAEMSKCRLYEKIFALNGGIFDRFKIKGQRAYEDGSHPVQYAKQEIKRILRKLAFELFQGNGESIKNKDYEKLVQNDIGKSEQIVYDFPVKNALEDNGSIEFVHKSIYEYFVAEYMFEEIRNGLQSENKEIMAGIFGDLLGSAEVTDEIYVFLEHLISQSEKTYDWHFIYSVFLLMLERGMTCFASTAGDINVIVRERRIFINMLKIIHIDHEGKIQIGKALESEFACYIKLSDWFTCLNLSSFGLHDICLSRVSLRRADLREADLRGADLDRADLGGAKLQKACLVEAGLSGTDLSGADLSGADLSGADLSGADLRAALLNGAYLIGADLSGACLDGAEVAGADFGGADL